MNTDHSNVFVNSDLFNVFANANSSRLLLISIINSRPWTGLPLDMLAEHLLQRQVLN